MTPRRWTSATRSRRRGSAEWLARGALDQFLGGGRPRTQLAVATGRRSTVLRGERHRVQGRAVPRRLEVLAFAVVAALVVAGCGSSGPKAPPQEPVYLNGDITKIPLNGTRTSPLYWTQPSNLTADQAAIALAAHRGEAMGQVLASGPARPKGVRFDPLLEQLWTGPFAQANIGAIGDTNTVGSPPGGFGPQAEKVISIVITGSKAVVNTCQLVSGRGVLGGIVMQSSPTDGGVLWREYDAGSASSGVSYDCATWGKSAVPSSASSGASPSS